MDDNGDKKLSKDELKYGLADYGIELNSREIDDIFSYFGKNVIIIIINMKLFFLTFLYFLRSR